MVHCGVGVIQSGTDINVVSPCSNSSSETIFKQKTDKEVQPDYWYNYDNLSEAKWGFIVSPDKEYTGETQ